MAPIINKSGKLSDIVPLHERVVVVSSGQHANIDKLCSLFSDHGENPVVVDVSGQSVSSDVLNVAARSADDFPLAFVKGNCAGTFDEVSQLNKAGHLKEWLNAHKYDLVVIGGGSGGLAAAKEAADLGKTVACLDFVKPSPIGTSWGLGGTCVNVGCIPKKLMHFASLSGEYVHDARSLGWKVDENISHNWEALREGVQNHIGSLNWGYRVALREKNVTYLNSYGSFAGSHTVKAVNKRGKEELVTADRFLVATGLRPRYPDVEGAQECCITSDDLFSLPYNPGKTLCIGASYVSLECAGFLRGLGNDVSVMVRSILLRGFDQDMANRIGEHMLEQGVKFHSGVVPVKFERLEEGKPGRIRVTGKRVSDGELIVDEYNTVIAAIGRDAITDDLNLAAAGVERNEKNKKLVCRANEQSVSAPWVYAVGDVLDGRPELTPVAIQAGRLLVHRLFNDRTQLTDYDKVPTTVFTPLEYGACGMSEEEAQAKYGEENIDVYHQVFNPLEHTVPARKDAKHCYAKLVCNAKDNLRVLGLHILAPNAGEITQGFALGLLMNATKADFDRLIGIHPTVAENFTTMAVTKREQPTIAATGC